MDNFCIFSSHKLWSQNILLAFVKVSWNTIFVWHLCTDLTISHFLFVLIYVVFISYAQEKALSSYKAMNNSISSSVQFLSFFPFPSLWLACGSATSTSPSAFIVHSPLLNSTGNQSILVSWRLNWETYDPEAKFVSWKQKCFWSKAKPSYCFRAAKFVSATCVSRGAKLGYGTFGKSLA